jgi:glycosyltransferase involved in cell wall biosynthesis
VSACRKQIRDANLEGRFHFIDHLNDPYVAYRAASVFVHASIEPEPFGMVILEAMQAGTPVVAADLGGPQEILEQGVSGVLVDPMNAQAVATSVVELLEDSSRREVMVAAAQHRVRTRFSVERAITEIERIYESELSSAQRRAIA